MGSISGVLDPFRGFWRASRLDLGNVDIIDEAVIGLLREGKTKQLCIESPAMI